MGNFAFIHERKTLGLHFDIHIDAFGLRDLIQTWDHVRNHLAMNPVLKVFQSSHRASTPGCGLDVNRHPTATVGDLGPADILLAWICHANFKSTARTRCARRLTGALTGDR